MVIIERGVTAMMKTTKIVNEKDITRKWHIVDAEGKILGRLASRVAMVLRGKDRPSYSPDRDLGDYVVIINAEKVAVTGNKMLQKKYYRHSGYRGNLKETNLKDMFETKPEDVLRHAVKGMIPKNKLGRQIMKRLRIFTGSEHTHSAQNPEMLDL
jgi:large subunit ribosomal protein L13